MMPRSDENMKELARDLSDLVLEHKALISRYEERLDGAGQLDTDDLMRSQIEFLVLNVRSAMVSKEQELRHVQSEVEYREQMAADPGPGRPVRINWRDGVTPPAQQLPTLTEWGAIMGGIPADAIERVFFRHNANPSMVMICYRLKDGSLLPIHNKTEKWEPSAAWELAFSELVEGLSNAD